MYPTQITSVLFLTNLAHGFVKQNYPIFFSGLPLYATTLMYHSMKHYIPNPTSTTLCKVDMFLCWVFYVAALCDYMTRRTIKEPYSSICVGFHIALPTAFIVGANYKIMMWSPDFYTSELWHAFYHLMICIEVHLYLYNT